MGENVELCRRKLESIVADKCLGDFMSDISDDGDHCSGRRRAKGQHFEVPRVVVDEEKVICSIGMKDVHLDPLREAARRYRKKEWLCSLDPRRGAIGTVLHVGLDMILHGWPPNSPLGDDTAAVNSEVPIVNQRQDVLAQRSRHE